MVTKEDEYKASTFQIAGFALLAPFGKIFLDPFTLFKEGGLIGIILFITFSLLIALLGLIFIDRGRDILNIKRRDRSAYSE